MRRIFQDFVDRLIESRNIDDLTVGLAEVAAALDLYRFAYLSLPRSSNGSPLLVSNYPLNWTSYYLKQRYQRFDPVVIQALRGPEPFEWGLDTGLSMGSPSVRELFEEAASFGIRYGFTIPVHDSKGAIAAVTFATDERRPSFDRSIARYADVLQLMAMCFHAHTSRTILANCRIDGRLSPREIECLEWASEGKSAWETGRIMGISRHTVAFHLDNAKAKLGVRSTIQAVARLAASGTKRTPLQKVVPPP